MVVEAAVFIAKALPFVLFGVAGLFLIGFIRSLITGRAVFAKTKNPPVSQRKEEPKAYWITMALIAMATLFIAGLGFYSQTMAHKIFDKGLTEGSAQ